ncbi:MAG: 3-deoxy-manno-octulosonate cytidylyltransferase [Parvularculaceae bacterium]|nr:3-deoxy-manno-octulosonate cytidylyltransferase [Parvularculaceae bacterium]
MRAAVIIPARLASSRLPEKLLLDLAGKPIIQHVYERALRAARADLVLVATDSDRIRDVVEGFGGEAVMTRPEHQSGSERIAEAAAHFGETYDVIVNVQGDEPEIDPANIDALIETQGQIRGFASTLACPFPEGLDPKEPAAVKVILGRRLDGAPQTYDGLYFTRAHAPYPRDGAGEFHLHIGVYAFSPQSLTAFAATQPSRLERIERLEQLRILEMGERIAVRIVAAAAPGIDTQADFDRAQARFSGV